MKIIVSNAAEQKLMQRFIDGLHESLLDDVETADHKWAKENNEDPYLSSIEYKFVEESLYETTVEVNPKEKPLAVDDSEIIVGTCTVCGKQTEGTIDGGPIDYEEYLRLTDKEAHKTWKCESCWDKERETL